MSSNSARREALIPYKQYVKIYFLPHRKHRKFLIKINPLVLFRIIVSPANHTQHNTAQNAGFLAR
jgi:hypothetical protein